ncbi:hypothetical protein, partial [Dickeya oryzae]|uniref:hypothetical protein n=1 Tax=Dickeya oryzae TaxID=1240404 RepID=UPI001AECE6D1
GNCQASNKAKGPVERPGLLFFGFRVNDRAGNDRLSRVNVPSAPWLAPGFYWISSGRQLETAGQSPLIGCLDYADLHVGFFTRASAPPSDSSLILSPLYIPAVLFCVHETSSADSAVHTKSVYR